VTIDLDPSLQASYSPINVSLETILFLTQQTRRFMGVNVEHKIADNFIWLAFYIKISRATIYPKEIEVWTRVG
jgi:hypothetical protein